MDTIATIGLDIAKTSFAAHCAASCGKEIKKADMKRAQVLPFFAAISHISVALVWTLPAP